MAILTNVKGLHKAAGIYQKETELTPVTNSPTSITTLGLVGETQKGPAFQPIYISSWRDFLTVFGGTSAELYKGSKYPRYELPYIAKDYLTESNSMFVTRVLGLSGYNAGKAWCLRSEGKGAGDTMLVGIIRSRAQYVETKGNPKFSNEEITSGNIEKDVQYVVGRKDQDKSNPLPPTAKITYNDADYTYGQKFFGTAVTDYTATGGVTVYGYCGTSYEHDTLEWDVEHVYITTAGMDNANYTCGKSGYWDGNTVGNSIPSTPTDLGTFKLVCQLTNGARVDYTVSLNPGHTNYIYKVLGSTPTDNTTPIFIEELYDVAFQQLVYQNGTNPHDYISGIKLGTQITANDDVWFDYNGWERGELTDLYDGLQEEGYTEPLRSKFAAVKNILTKPPQSLSAANVGERYLYSLMEVGDEISFDYIEEVIKVGKWIGSDNKTVYKTEKITTNKILGAVDDEDYTAPNIFNVVDDGKILTVKETISGNNVRSYDYYYTIIKEYTDEADYNANSNDPDKVQITQDRLQYESGLNPDTNGAYSEVVFVNDLKMFYEIAQWNATGGYDYHTITRKLQGDISNYKDQYRYASTPWLVSEMIGTYGNNEVKRLCRFHTVSDGNNTNDLVKISIQNINPATLSFDVVVRDFYDTDSNIIVLENFANCNLNPDSSNYVLEKIGDIFNAYPLKSNYILAEVANEDSARHHFPCGFMGLPVRLIGDTSATPSTAINAPHVAYKTNLDEEVNSRRQYFGFSDLLGIDVDLLTYKGVTAYTDGYYTDGFHLDSRVSDDHTKVDGENPVIDGTQGIYTWQTIGIDQLGAGEEPPMITSPEDILGTIYENPLNRKFTLCFFGGYDGWDPYRTVRSTGDNFKKSKYKGLINPVTGEGNSFNVLRNADKLGIAESAITSDYYAFLGGYLTMRNPAETPINIIATPGIDYVNQTLLTHEVIEMVESDDNQKMIYITTTPDKPSGAGENISEMYTPLEAVGNLELADIDSSYVATFYPWVRYHDDELKKIIFLPPTRDVIRSIANIDNTSYQWYPPAGDARGRITGLSARRYLNIDDLDTLYGNRINPLKSFARDGCFVMGQKTLKVSYYNDIEPLTRIGVRRMMIRVKELVARANRSLIFTPNDQTTRTKFFANTDAILRDVRSNRGISDYKIEVDDSVEAREARTLPAKIFVKPINMLEFIEIEYVVASENTPFS
jgi:hypothetical protein